MLLPLKVDVPMWRRPWVNYLILAATILISILGFTDKSLFLSLAGAQEAASFLGRGGLQLAGSSIMSAAVTSTFLHAGFLHLAGNMWFLWVFGNAINYKFGQWQYLLLYLFCGFAGSMAHYGFTHSPAVGASGAINGIMGAFIVLFPRNNINMLFLYGFYGKTFTLSSIWIVIFWFAWDVFSLSLGIGGNVALWGHIGGFLTGFLIALLCTGAGWIKPTEDEQTLLQLLGSRR